MRGRYIRVLVFIKLIMKLMVSFNRPRETFFLLFFSFWMIAFGGTRLSNIAEKHFIEVMNTNINSVDSR